MEAHIGPFGDKVNLHARLVHDLHRTCNRLGNHFGHTRWKFLVTWVLGDMGQVEAHFGPYRDNVNHGAR
jgi:hypothetical protein